ncbi:MAG: hypothetical protein Q8R37_01045 [Nanoarchaeota archaeon]|nr:hypothetical protein [Nanoarchaeota archaeon]
MDVTLYVKEDGTLKVLKVPVYVVKDLLRDRLGQSELKRINRFAEKIKAPDAFKPGSVVVDFSNKTATCFQAGLNIKHLEPTWEVSTEEVTLVNY